MINRYYGRFYGQENPPKWYKLVITTPDLKGKTTIEGGVDKYEMEQKAKYWHKQKMVVNIFSSEN